MTDGDVGSAAPATTRPRARSRAARHTRWAVYAWGTLALVSLLVAVPLALGSIVKQLLMPPEVQSYVLAPGGRAGAVHNASANALRVTVAAIDEAKKAATFRISGYRPCGAVCPALTVQLFALDDAIPQRAGPPSATVKVPEGATVIMETITLPIRGTPSLYPFDTYRMLVGTSVTLEGPSGPTLVQAAPLAGVPIAIESEVARFVMAEPELGSPDLAAATDLHPAFQRVVGLRFHRPLHLLVLTCLLIGLIAAAAVLSVVTEPLRSLVVGVGSVILGVWGIRSVLLSDAPSVVTSVDLLLSGVILILLYGIVIRLLLVWRREGWDGLLHLIQSR